MNIVLLNCSLVLINNCKIKQVKHLVICIWQVVCFFFLVSCYFRQEFSTRPRYIYFQIQPSKGTSCQCRESNFCRSQKWDDSHAVMCSAPYKKTSHRHTNYRPDHVNIFVWFPHYSCKLQFLSKQLCWQMACWSFSSRLCQLTGLPPTPFLFTQPCTSCIFLIPLRLPRALGRWCIQRKDSFMFQEILKHAS